MKKKKKTNHETQIHNVFSDVEQNKIKKRINQKCRGKKCISQMSKGSHTHTYTKTKSISSQLMIELKSCEKKTCAFQINVNK